MRLMTVAMIVALCALTIVARGEAQEAPEPPAAMNAGADEVLLKRGGVVRGTVVSLEPGQQVVILVAGAAEPRTIPWGEVADVQRGKYGPEAAHVPAPSPTPEPPGYEPVPRKPAPKQGVVRLHILSDDPDVRLYENSDLVVRGVGGYGVVVPLQQQRVCRPPCDVVLDASGGSSFYFSGDGIPPSDEFDLSAYQGDVTARVAAGSIGLQKAGWVIFPFGCAAAGLGAALLITSAVADSSADTEYTLNVSGGVLLGVGAVVSAGGIAMIALGGTSFELEPGAPASESATNRPRERAPRYWLGEF